MGGSSVVDSSAHNIRIETSGNGEAIGGAVGRVMRGKILQVEVKHSQIVAYFIKCRWISW